VRAVPDEISFRSDVTVELVRANASDADVLFAARVSTQGEQTLEAAQDESLDTSRSKGLINYLMRDRHGSPFEHNSMTFYVQAPIFVFREFMRHRMASYNEESGRYRELNPVFYVPAPSRNLVQVGKAGAYDFLPGTPDPARPRMRPISGCWMPALRVRLRGSCCPSRSTHPCT
jgi:thymidylate synthase (FAD)